MSLSSPLDVLFMDEDAQSVLGCVQRQPRATMERIVHVTGINPQQLDAVVARLVRDSHLVEEKQDGQSVFTVQYQRTPPPASTRPSALDLFC